MNLDEEKIKKYFSKAIDHFKINQKPKLVMNYEKPKTKLDELTPARYNSTKNEIIFLPEVFDKYDFKNLEWITFHEIAHAGTLLTYFVFVV